MTGQLSPKESKMAQEKGKDNSGLHPLFRHFAATKGYMQLVIQADSMYHMEVIICLKMSTNAIPK